MTYVRAIFNPMTAGGRRGRLEPDLRARLTNAASEAGLKLEWVATQAPKHAIALAEEAATDGCELVVAVGGDGTVNEVVNGLMRAGSKGDSTTLGVVPVGSGNDFAWQAGIPLDADVACQRVFDGRTRVVDVGHIREADGRERYFDNGCGIGFDGQVSVEVKRLQWLRGFLMYLVAVLKTLILHHQAPVLRIRLDERELTRASMMLTVSNGRRHGGGFLVTPEAELDDGLLDVCIAGELSRPAMLMIIPRFMRGTHVTHKQVQMDRARRVRVESPIQRPIHLDGEIFATDARQFEIRVIPGALRVRV
ncbi:MAG: diacylglycerol kinase family lipid kinase [Anaerolineae bacterium]|nr:MAG: diacylglycerol kinase family lipid kinase [Anaerolineae bacterium]